MSKGAFILSTVSTRRAAAICVFLASFTACGGPQGTAVPPAAVQGSIVSPQSTAEATSCPVVGKTYTRGDSKGKVSIQFRQAYVKAGYNARLRTQLVYSNWPEDRPLLYRGNKLTTCGIESGKPPLGEVQCCGGSTHGECHNGVCTWTLNLEINYRPPATLPSRKKWKFDLVSFTTEKKMKGFEPLPAYRIVITR